MFRDKPEMLVLSKYLIQQIRIRRRERKVVSLDWVKVMAKKKVSELSDAGSPVVYTKTKLQHYKQTTTENKKQQRTHNDEQHCDLSERHSTFGFQPS